MVVRLIVLWVLLLAVSSSVFAAEIFRLWHGVGIQGAQSDWSTEVDLRLAVPKVRYPSLNCSGVWQPLGVENGVHLFREVILEGRKTCIDGFVKVSLLCKTRLGIVYFQFADGPEIARAVVFPGPHHEDAYGFMIGKTREFIASGDVCDSFKGV